MHADGRRPSILTMVWRCLVRPSDLIEVGSSGVNGAGLVLQLLVLLAATCFGIEWLKEELFGRPHEIGYWGRIGLAAAGDVAARLPAAVALYVLAHMMAAGPRFRDVLTGYSLASVVAAVPWLTVLILLYAMAAANMYPDFTLCYLGGAVVLAVMAFYVGRYAMGLFDTEFPGAVTFGLVGVFLGWLLELAIRRLVGSWP